MPETEENSVVTPEEARERVQRLATHWNWPEPTILEDIIALGEDSIAPIEELLTPELLKAAREDDRAGAIAYYCLRVLGEVGSPRAVPPMVDLLRWVDDDTLDWTLEVFKHQGPEAIDPLLALATDTSLPWYPRAMAVDTAERLAGTDPAWRARIGDSLRPILEEYRNRAEPPNEEEREIIGSFVSTLAALADPNAKPIIEALFEADRVLKPKKGSGPFDNIPIIDRDEVEELYAEGGEPPRDLLPHTPLVERYRKQYQEHLEAERREKRLAVFDEPELPPQPYVSGRRLGRNDPCWCGCGKKYKKCHLAQDEQARRTSF